MATTIDSALFGHMFGTDEMRRIFSDETKIQRWMDVEAALARAESRVGIVPEAHADEIGRKCSVKLIDLDELKREFLRTDHAVMALVHCYAAICEPPAGESVHWGATTQDILDTGAVLQLRDANDLIVRDLHECLRLLCEQAQRNKYVLQAGRTQGQHALPITFGFKVAVWADEVKRHLQRLEQLSARLFHGQFAGAVGTLASLGEQGLEVQRLMFAELGLSVPDIAWHSARDRFVELVCTYAMIGGTLAKIASEVFDLQRTEIAELAEPFHRGKLGSSTMPHKRNPSSAANVPALHKLLSAQVTPALACMVVANERDSRSWNAEWSFLAESCCLLGAMLQQVNHVLGGLEVYAPAMRRNLDLLHGLMLSENVMLALGERIGRQHAHEVMYRLCMDAIEHQRPLKDLLIEDEATAGVFTAEQLDQMLDPSRYTGLAAYFVDRVTKTQDSAG